MTPRDLAAGLSQAASAVLGMQNAKDGNLPLMRGSIANAVDAVGGIKLFLADQVPDADPDDQTPGQPKFASLQDMLAALDYGTGRTCPGLRLDHRRPRRPGRRDRQGRGSLRRDLEEGQLHPPQPPRGVATPLELNVLGAATTGTATYTATGLSVTGGSASPQATGTELAGRKVTSGASYGTVAAVPTATTLTLTGDGWSGGQPANGIGVRRRGGRPQDRRPRVRRRPQDHDRHRHGQRRGLDRDGHAGRRARPCRWRWT